MAAPPELYDLHVHSTRSDGLRSVMELAHLASLCGLAGIAITDHDILPDPVMLADAGRARGVQMLPGIEISTVWNHRRLHLLGYGFETSSRTPLHELCDEVLAARHERWEKLIEGLRAKNVKLDDTALARLRHQGSPGRKHLARELVRLRRASSVRMAFDKYLSPLDADLSPIGIDLARAIQAIHDSGGVAVLAHPPTGMTVDEWRAISLLGLDGIETRFGKVANAHRRFLEDRSKEYGWVQTAGSDYHGDGTRNHLGLHSVDRLGLDDLLARKPQVV
ncbi:PHP domain-containing protein [bacterium]|nr:PHP domain-containing protein [bacterium]